MVHARTPTCAWIELSILYRYSMSIVIGWERGAWDGGRLPVTDMTVLLPSGTLCIRLQYLPYL